MPARTILMVGLRTDAVDFNKWPELNPQKLEQAFVTVKSTLETAGLNAIWCLIDAGTTARAVLTEALRQHTPDTIVIGAGVRTDPDHLELFELAINLIHAHAPRARIVFNQNPIDTLAAVERAQRYA